ALVSREAAMTANAVLQVLVYFAVLTATAIPLGAFMARAAAGEGVVARVLGPVERACLRLAGVHADDEMDARRYAKALLAFTLAGTVVVYALERLQASLPLNPLKLGAVEPGVAFNTAVSF